MSEGLTHIKYNRLLYLYIVQEGKCYYCHDALFADGKLRPCDTDHKQPLSRGGNDREENVVLSCVECNRAKANMTEGEFHQINRLVENGQLLRNDIHAYVQFCVLNKKFGHIDVNAPRALPVVHEEEVGITPLQSA